MSKVRLDKNENTKVTETNVVEVNEINNTKHNVNLTKESSDIEHLVGSKSRIDTEKIQETEENISNQLE